jgi:hypothetical protein
MQNEQHGESDMQEIELTKLHEQLEHFDLYASATGMEA